MPAKITVETIERLAELSKLNFTQAEKAQAQEELAAMLEYIDHLQELNTEGVEPAFYNSPAENVFREDVVVAQDHQTAIFQNAPAVKDGYFLVAKTLHIS